MAPRVALIVGAGSNTGAALVKRFLGAGYRVATVARSERAPSGAPANRDVLHIQADISDPSNVPVIFSKLKSEVGWTFPSVVVWNASALTPPAASDAENIFSVPLEALDKDLNVMVKSPYLAAAEALKAWRSLGEQEEEKNKKKGTFIMTGNGLPRITFREPMFTTLGTGKSAANFWVGLADTLYGGKGMRFFFADERNADASPMLKGVDGESHAEFYLRLAEEDNESIPSYATFVKGKYQEFK